MKNKIFSIILGIFLICNIVYAQPVPMNPVVSGIAAITIVDAAVTHTQCRAVWVGTTQSIDLYFVAYGWVTFQGATAGTLIPVQVKGARITAGSAAPNTNDIVFIY